LIGIDSASITFAQRLAQNSLRERMTSNKRLFSSMAFVAAASFDKTSVFTSIDF
jgi:hypothetical protein